MDSGLIIVSLVDLILPLKLDWGLLKPGDNELVLLFYSFT